MSGTDFFLWDESSCWICGYHGKLTAEHKFKASDLRASFGSKPMLGVLGHDPNADAYVRELQSPNSKFAQFRASICSQCNNARTQSHDRAYDELSARLRELMKDGREPFEIAQEEPWCDGSNAATISTLRYFAKHLGCIAAVVGMPIPSILPTFILEQIERCQIHPRVFTHTDLKEFITHERKTDPNLSRVGHSGLAILFDDEIAAPIAYRFGVEIDWAQIEVRYEFSGSEVNSLQAHFPDQLQYARDNALLQKQA